VNDAELHTIKRRADDPKLDIGDSVVVKEGVTGIILARYTPSAHNDEVHYIVAVPAQKHVNRPR